VTRLTRVAALTATVPVVLLVAGSSQAKQPRHIDIEVQGPHQVHVGQHYCARGRVTNQRDRGVGRALVRLDSRQTRTGKRGGFKLCQRLYYAGTHAAFAYKGDDKAHAKIRLGGGAPQGAGDWRYFSFGLGPTSSCSGSPYEGLTPISPFGHGGSGWCQGYAGGTDPFLPARAVKLRWDPSAGQSVSVEIETLWDRPRIYLSGVLSGHLGDFNITGTEGWDPDVVGGSDPKLRGRPGGPLELALSGVDTYTFSLRGYVLEK
jgi:hypothetical protein